MGHNKVYENQEWDAWEHFEEDNLVPIKSKAKKVKKMKLDKPLTDRKRK